MYTSNQQYTSAPLPNQMGMYPQTVYQPIPQPVYVQQPVYIQQPPTVVYQQPVVVSPYPPATNVKNAFAAGITAGVVGSLLRPHPYFPPPHHHHHHHFGRFPF